MISDGKKVFAFAQLKGEQKGKVLAEEFSKKCMCSKIKHQLTGLLICVIMSKH